MIGNEATQEVGRWMNNRCENSHLPFRRREHAMLKFRLRQTLQKFSVIDSSVSNHFNQEGHLTSRDIFKFQRNAALQFFYRALPFQAITRLKMVFLPQIHLEALLQNAGGQCYAHVKAPIIWNLESHIKRHGNHLYWYVT